MLNAAARTHTGRVRPHNEDAHVCRPDHGLFAVIDGMGGEAAGEVAAAIAAAAITEVPPARKLDGEKLLSDALHTARDRILQAADRDPSCHAMGAVATALRFDDRGQAVLLAHVGDTRVWRVNGAGVTQLTEDHVAPEPEPGRSKSAVTRDLGRRDLTGEWVATSRHAVARNDLLVMASDGLHDAVGPDELDAELRRLWASPSDADAICARLVALALARGGPDNVTVLAIRVGKFRRGAGTGLRRLGLPGSLAVLAVLLVLVFLVVGRDRGASSVPAKVSQDVALYQREAYALPSGGTVVDAGRTLELRGVELTGPDWVINVQPRGSVTLTRSVLTTPGPVRVQLGEGARLRVEDSRIDASQLQIDGSKGVVELVHATLPGTVLVDERLDLKEDDVRTLLPAGAPTAMPPGEPDDAGSPVPPAAGATPPEAPTSGPASPTAAPASPTPSPASPTPGPAR